MRKLSELRKELEAKNRGRRIRIREKYLKERDNIKKLDDLKIIGITGSNGKSTVAYIIHEYLKKLGYKSVLYSSCKIDSPASYISPNNGAEISFRTEDDLLEIIDTCEAYKADYLVLEVNERNIENGLVKNIPFNIKVLTSLIPEHNLSRYSKEEYVNIKKSFFEDKQNEINIIGYQGYDKDIFNELVNINKKNTITFSSEYISKIKGINTNEFDILLTKMDLSKDGTNFEIKEKFKNLMFRSNLLFGHNVLNLICVLSIIKGLEKYEKNIYNYQIFDQVINNLIIPGRCECYNKGEGIVIIDTHMTKTLDGLKELKKNGLIDKIKVVVGSIGYGFKNWNDDYKKEEYINKTHIIRKKAMDKLKEVNYVYITESDSGKESTLSICNELSQYLDEKVNREIIVDRTRAIEKALNDLGAKEALLITGRGNRKLLCDSENNIRLLKDSDIVLNYLNTLK